MPILFSLYLVLTLWIHPYYVSIFTIHYDLDDRTVQVTAKIFADDLELAIEKETGRDSLFIGTKFEHSDADSLIHTYLQNHFNVTLDDQPISLNYLGKENEVDVVWIYLESPELQKPSMMGIETDVLTREYIDQMNIVHLERGDDRKSYLLGIEKTSASATFD